jgi:hypothetical protein
MAESDNKENDGVIARQTQFYRDNKAGCGFAAFAARNPGKFRWSQRICAPAALEVDEIIRGSISDEAVATLSVIFPAVRTEDDLKALLLELRTSQILSLELNILTENRRCVGYRAKVEPFVSWVSGFGPFEFFPKTRQAPYVELAMRVKPRPPYETVMKEAPEGVIHLADMNMQGMPENDFKRLWGGTMRRTAKLLGHEPDLESAAKTTFVIPADWEL